jgi:hypothetical protein
MLTFLMLTHCLLLGLAHLFALTLALVVDAFLVLLEFARSLQHLGLELAGTLRVVELLDAVEDLGHFLHCVLQTWFSLSPLFYFCSF